MGKITNFFKKIGVAEIQVEASPLERGARYVVLGETTGALEGSADEVYVADRPAETIKSSPHRRWSRSRISRGTF